MFSVSSILYLAPTLDFVSHVFDVDEDDGTVTDVVCMILTPPAGGMECELEVPLSLANGKAGELYILTQV